MKIMRPNRFRIGPDPKQVENYLTNGLQKSLSDISTVLRHLTFQDNFKSETFEITIDPTSEVVLKHNLGVVPTGKLLLRQNVVTIVDGDTAWTVDEFSVKNTGAVKAVITLILLG